MDWWSLGVLVYEMVTGLTPWRHPNICTLYDLILSASLVWPATTPGLEEETVDFVSLLLVRDSQKRLGGGGRGAEQVKSHPWLKVLDWEGVEAGRLRPPVVPAISHPGDGAQYPDYGEDMWWDVHEIPPADRETHLYILNTNMY